MTDAASEAAAWFSQFGSVETAPRTRFQKVVARTMSKNVQNIPHVTHHDMVDASALEAARRAAPDGKKFSPLLYLVKAVVDALKAFPHFNASLTPDGDSLILKNYYHIGIAVDGPLGLLVPVLHDADQKDMAELDQMLRRLAAQARDKGLPMDAMSGGCFSISSLGGIGGTHFTPIINAPEVAILGATSIRTEPIWNGETFEPRPMLPLSLSYDHRVINGADAARFVNHIGQSLAAITP